MNPNPPIRIPESELIRLFPLIWENRRRIRQTPELYLTGLGKSASCGSMFVGCRELSLGMLLELWEEGRWKRACPQCAGALFLYYVSGSILSGVHVWRGICRDCLGTNQGHRKALPGETKFCDLVQAAFRIRPPASPTGSSKTAGDPVPFTELEAILKDSV